MNYKTSKDYAHLRELLESILENKTEVQYVPQSKIPSKEPVIPYVFPYYYD